MYNIYWGINLFNMMFFIFVFGSMMFYIDMGVLDSVYYQIGFVSLINCDLLKFIDYVVLKFNILFNNLFGLVIIVGSEWSVYLNLVSEMVIVVFGMQMEGKVSIVIVFG